MPTTEPRPMADRAVRYARRVVRALGWERWAVVFGMTLLWSSRRLFTPEMVDFFTPVEIAFLGVELFAEMAAIAAVLMLGYTLLDEALPALAGGRLWLIAAALLGLAMALTALLYAYYGHTFDDLPPPLRLFADSLRWGFPAVMLALVTHVHRRALRAESAADAEEQTRLLLRQDEAEQQLALLQAQIEPHFLFNVLGNVRRLYRTRPEAGAQAVASLRRYLREALPQLRSARARLGNELELVRAYLDLFKLRMGARLTFSIESDAALDELEFPPMLLMTLVENAIKHGIEPAGRAGHVSVQARRDGAQIVVEVIDDGAGFSCVPSGGTGVGLVNIRRQLAARYGSEARLALEARDPRGARAVIALPVRLAAAAPARSAGAMPRTAPV
ncbi:MAG: histidine kinase [Burkholderiaceae bacterium]